jgi:hypothetical protein
MSKGNTVTSIASSCSQAGWVFNSDYDYFSNGLRYHMRTNQALAILQTNAMQFQTNSFFASFNYPLLYSPTQGSAEAQKLDVRAEVLGGGIPALSHATGASYIAAFGGSRNKDLMSMETTDLAGNFLWPSIRPLDSSQHPRWLHSDFKYVAYPFNYRLYEDIVGKLNN